jgi:hypothetical protein
MRKSRQELLRYAGNPEVATTDLFISGDGFLHTARS